MVAASIRAYKPSHDTQEFAVVWLDQSDRLRRHRDTFLDGYGVPPALDNNNAVGSISCGDRRLLFTRQSLRKHHQPESRPEVRHRVRTRRFLLFAF